MINTIIKKTMFPEMFHLVKYWLFLGPHFYLFMYFFFFISESKDILGQMLHRILKKEMCLFYWS